MDELFAEHWDRTLGWAKRYASGRDDAEDIAQEAMANTLAAMRGGKGPATSVGLYLATAVRTVAMERGKRLAKVTPVAEFYDDLDRAVDEPVEAGEAVQAFTALPDRWREVLWLRNVEGYSTAEVASSLGMTTGAVTALHRRALVGIRQSYLDALAESPESSGCPRRRSMLARYVREELSEREQTSLEQHLEECRRCRSVVAYFRTVRRKIALALPFPILVFCQQRPLAAAAAGSTLAAATTAGALLVSGPIAATSLGGGFSAGDDTGQSPTVVLSAGPRDDCNVSAMRSGDRTWFDSKNDSGESCTVSFLWEGQLLLSPTEIADGNRFMAPRTGSYTVVLTADGDEVRSEYSFRP
nr:sigma-70 family RNA polymerase sigma factor [Lysinibacter cavernae]